MPQPSEERVVRVRFPVRVKPERFELTPPVPVPRQLLDRLRSETRPPDLETVASADSVVFPDIEIPMVEGPAFREEEKREAVAADTLDRSFDFRESMPELATVRDLVELDAIGRERTAVIVDPEAGKLKKAYLHLPAQRGHGTLFLSKTLDLMR